VTVSPAAAATTPVRVLAGNIHVGKSIVQGIDSVLMPPRAPAAGAGAAAKPAAAAAAVATEAGPRAAGAAAAAAAAPKAAAGRKLLQVRCRGAGCVGWLSVRGAPAPPGGHVSRAE
jgi:hypothetical protein